MKSQANKSRSWTTIRKQLATWDMPALIALVKELYDAADINRDFIQARCLSKDPGSEILEKYRKKIVDQFFPTRGFGKLQLGEARKAIREYAKITHHTSGVAELLMTYVENGVEFTCAYGDIDERFYSSVESVLKELAQLLKEAAPDLYHQFAERLAAVARASENIGWGFGDYVEEVVFDLEESFGDE